MFNALYTGDCLDILGRLQSGSVHLIYLDPPFNTKLTRKTKRAAYADSFGSPQDYVAYMLPRVSEMRRVLSPQGALFFTATGAPATMSK